MLAVSLCVSVPDMKKQETENGTEFAVIVAVQHCNIQEGLEIYYIAAIFELTTLG